MGLCQEERCSRSLHHGRRRTGSGRLKEASAPGALSAYEQFYLVRIAPITALRPCREASTYQGQAQLFCLPSGPNSFSKALWACSYTQLKHIAYWSTARRESPLKCTLPFVSHRPFSITMLFTKFPTLQRTSQITAPLDTFVERKGITDLWP